MVFHMPNKCMQTLMFKIDDVCIERLDELKKILWFTLHIKNNWRKRTGKIWNKYSKAIDILNR